MRRSTRARKLQNKIGYWMLAHRKRPKELIAPSDWNTHYKVWHVKELEPAAEHCRTCECQKVLISLCKGFQYNKDHWRYRTQQEIDFTGKRPCKRCLARLAKMAEGDK